jgi:hypothetical protein
MAAEPNETALMTVFVFETAEEPNETALMTVFVL